MATRAPTRAANHVSRGRSPSSHPSTKGQTHLGIYAFDGDIFKSCFGAPGAERPTDMVSKPGDRRTASEWKRQRPGAKPDPKGVAGGQVAD